MVQSARLLLPAIAVGLSMLSLPALAGDDDHGHFRRHGDEHVWDRGYGPPGHAYGSHRNWRAPAYVYAPYYAAPRVHYVVPPYYVAPAYYEREPQMSLSFSLSGPLR
jgi:hypothetical protein